MNYAKLIDKMVEKDNLPYLVNTFGIEYLNKIIHTLNYEDMLEICKILENTDEGFYYHSGHDTKNIYVFQCCSCNDCDLKEISSKISSKAFKMLYCDESDNSIETQDYWIPVFFIKEFWEFYEKFLNDLNEQKNENKNENEGEENMNEMETEMEYDCENTSNTKEICRTIATDLLQNYESYENILNNLNEISEDDETDVTSLATLFERLFK